MCIDTVVIWFGIANGQISCPPHDSGRVLLFHVLFVLWHTWFSSALYQYTVSLLKVINICYDICKLLEKMAVFLPCKIIGRILVNKNSNM